MAKGLKLKVRKFYRLVPTFVEGTGEKLVGLTNLLCGCNEQLRYYCESVNRYFLDPPQKKIYPRKNLDPGEKILIHTKNVESRKNIDPCKRF